MAVYQPNEAGFTLLATSPKVRKHMLFIGEYWASELRVVAPRGVDSNVYKYADSITVDSLIVEIGREKKLPRGAAQITANVPYASVLEVGAKDKFVNPPRPMTKLLDRMQAADPELRTKDTKG